MKKYSIEFLPKPGLGDFLCRSADADKMSLSVVVDIKNEKEAQKADEYLSEHGKELLTKILTSHVIDQFVKYSKDEEKYALELILLNELDYDNPEYKVEEVTEQPEKAVNSWLELKMIIKTAEIYERLKY